ncbi:MAG: peptide chain release factor N(5)-glutamine methyltransferase [Betaproteobacteria bacterium]|nr:peptide chain release factor N(5)-glutamine methyltransferase [Betaproteobacteria bacterium]
MTVGEALRALEPLEARLLLAEATGFSAATLIAFPEKALPADAQQRFTELVSRRRRGEPVAYLLGRKEFYGIELVVTPAVLVPRPETELLVERALAQPFARALDLGTGSGAIALALKRYRPRATVVAVESSAAALVVAKRNAARLGLEVDFRHGRWLDPVDDERFDLIVANPPYVAEGDPHLGALVFEPREALVSGPEGLDALREIAERAPAHLSAGGWLFLEHGFDQGEAVRRLLAGLEAVQTWPDLSGIGRVTGGRR